MSDGDCANQANKLAMISHRRLSKQQRRTDKKKIHITELWILYLDRDDAADCRGAHARLVEQFVTALGSAAGGPRHVSAVKIRF